MAAPAWWTTTIAFIRRWWWVVFGLLIMVWAWDKVGALRRRRAQTEHRIDILREGMKANQSVEEMQRLEQKLDQEQARLQQIDDKLKKVGEDYGAETKPSKDAKESSQALDDAWGDPPPN